MIIFLHFQSFLLFFSSFKYVAFHCCLIKHTLGLVLVWPPLNALSHVRMAQNVLRIRIIITLYRQNGNKLALTYCCIISGDINQDLCGASSTNVSVAVPHTGNQVSLAKTTTWYSVFNSVIT